MILNNNLLGCQCSFHAENEKCRQAEEIGVIAFACINIGNGGLHRLLIVSAV